VFGIFLVSIDFWNILVSGSAMFLAVSFRNWKKFKYCKSPLNKSNNDEAKRSANYHVRQAKYEYERSIATNIKENNKIFWKFIQSKTKSKENIPCIMDENEFSVTWFIHGVLNFFVIDLHTGILSSYVLDILSANLFQSSSISPWASSKFQSYLQLKTLLKAFQYSHQELIKNLKQ
jgi:hypothetical protein